MELIVISSSQKSNSEIPIIETLFENGLTYYHIKKRNWDKKKMKDFLKKIPKKFHSKLVLHQHFSLAVKFKLRGVHLGHREKKSLKNRIQLAFLKLWHPKMKLSCSFNNLQDFINSGSKYDYVFLKPVFDRHSLLDFSQTFSRKQLEANLPNSKKKVFALGSVSAEKVPMAQGVGFDGVVLQGSFWNQREKKMDFFKAVHEACSEPTAQSKSMGIRPVRINMT